MRISAVGFAARNMNEVKTLSRAVTAISHDHPEGLKGAESVAMAIFLARQSKTKRQIRGYIEQNYYKIGFTLDEIRGTYEFNETCQNTVPQAFEAFFEAKDFEDAIRNAVSVGGDSDTLAAITGSIRCFRKSMHPNFPFKLYMQLFAQLFKRSLLLSTFC